MRFKSSDYPEHPSCDWRTYEASPDYDRGYYQRDENLTTCSPNWAPTFHRQPYGEMILKHYWIEYQEHY